MGSLIYGPQNRSTPDLPMEASINLPFDSGCRVLLGLQAASGSELLSGHILDLGILVLQFQQRSFVGDSAAELQDKQQAEEMSPNASKLEAQQYSRLQIARNRFYLHTLSPEVGIIYIYVYVDVYTWSPRDSISHTWRLACGFMVITRMMSLQCEGYPSTRSSVWGGGTWGWLLEVQLHLRL